jgi:hypothetical protein
MNPTIAISLAEQRRHELMYEAYSVRTARQARRASRSGSRRAQRRDRQAVRYRFRPIYAFQAWVASGQL